MILREKKLLQGKEIFQKQIILFRVEKVISRKGDKIYVTKAMVICLIAG